MKWNADMRQLVQRKKEAYPTKRSMNLYFKMDRTTAPATLALYVLFGLAIVLALFKFTIYDPIDQVNQLQNQLLILEQQAITKLEELKDYDKVQEDYIRATTTQDELSQVDRMEILSLIDNTIRPAARISKVSIEKDKVLLTFSGVSLQEAANLVTELEQAEFVTNTSVDTAVSIRGNQRLVEINVYFELVREEEKQP